MIDIHTHHLLPEHWGDEFERHWRPVYGSSWPRLGPSEFDEAMAGVSTACVFGITAARAGVRTPNKIIAEFCAATTTTTIGFMALDPTDEDVDEQLEEGLELGLRGVKLYPVLAGFSPVDPVH